MKSKPTVPPLTFATMRDWRISLLIYRHEKESSSLYYRPGPTSARTESHGPPTKLKLVAGGGGGRARARETPEGAAGDSATQVEP